MSKITKLDNFKTSKELLENNIFELIEDFENDWGAKIDSIELFKLASFRSTVPDKKYIKIEIKL